MTRPSPRPPLSVLDLSPIVEGGSARDALRNSLDLAPDLLLQALEVYRATYRPSAA